MKVLPTMGSSYSGSLRGITASHNKGGLYFRGRTIPTNPGTGLQVAVRNAFGSLAQRWSTVLTQMQRDGWDAYAQNVSWVDSLGQNIQLSGVNHYVRANTPRVQLMVLDGTITVIDDAPMVQELGMGVQVDAAAISNAVGPPNVISAGFDITNNGDFGATDRVVIYLGIPQNPGIKGFNGPYVLAGFDTADQASVAATMFDDTPNAAPYSDRFGEPQVGQRIFGYARTLMADGRLSQRQKIDFGLVPTAS